MLYKYLYISFFILSGMLLSGCSNLIDSAFKPVPTEESVVFSETFLDNIGGFKAVSNIGDQKWEYSSKGGGCALMTGYVNSVNNANEDWFISPEIDLTNVVAANLTFDYVLYKGNTATDATVWVTDNFKNDSVVRAEDWVQIRFDVTPDGGSYTFIGSDQLSLTAFAGKKVRIGLRYNSTATSAGTFEIRNFLVKNGEAVVTNASIYSESFSSGFGGFKAVDVVGDTTWYIDSRGYAMMSGYVANQNLANEDWLISPQIDLTDKVAANFSFDHVARYFASLATEATVLISEDYIDGLPSTGSWVKVVTNPFFDPGAWTFSNSQKISLTAYCGKKIRIAFKYISTQAKAGSWEIKNFKVNDGEANGIQSNPYTVLQAVSSQTGGVGWVEGYVVGYVWAGSNVPFIFDADTCSQRTNIIIADTTRNVYSSRALAVQLPRGGIRNGLNLQSNKSLIGQKVKVYGTLSNNAGIAGLVNTQTFVLQNGTTGSSTITTHFSESFSANLGLFTTESKVGTQAWKWQSGFGATMSGYSGTAVENEDWLISPVIDLTSLNSAALTFDHTINKGVVTNMRSEQTLLITEDNWTTWQQLAIPVYPAGNNWTFVNAGEIDLDKYAGKTIKIAFKYNCTTTSSATWEVKNIKVYY